MHRTYMTVTGGHYCKVKLIEKSLRILFSSMERLYRTFFETWQTNAAFQRGNTSKMLACYQTFSKVRDVFRALEDIRTLDKLRTQLAAAWNGLLDNYDDSQLLLLARNDIAYAKKFLYNNSLTSCTECAQYQRIGHCARRNEIMSRYLIARSIIANIGQYRFGNHSVNRDHSTR